MEEITVEQQIDLIVDILENMADPDNSDINELEVCLELREIIPLISDQKEDKFLTLLAEIIYAVKAVSQTPEHEIADKITSLYEYHGCGDLAEGGICDKVRNLFALLPGVWQDYLDTISDIINIFPIPKPVKS